MFAPQSSRSSCFSQKGHFLPGKQQEGKPRGGRPHHVAQQTQTQTRGFRKRLRVHKEGRQMGVSAAPSALLMSQTLASFLLKGM